MFDLCFMQTFCDIKDLSYGRETVPISCVNGIDRQYPDYVEYSNQRIPAKGVNLNLDPEFLVGCDCTDGCRVSSTHIKCWNFTLDQSEIVPAVEISIPFIAHLQQRLSSGSVQMRVHSDDS